MRSTMSILGLYQWDDTIFENLVVPDGVDASLAVDSILFDNAELEIMYSDPEWMKSLIGMWSQRELPVWERIYRAITRSYNPLENYNRTETWSDKEDEDTTITSSSTDSGSSTRTPNLTSTHKVTGYNDAVLTESSQDVDTGTEGIISSNTNSGSGSESKDRTLTRIGNVSGNIGITTSQQMLNQELDVSERTDIYMYISESFKNRFCLMVY